MKILASIILGLLMITTSYSQSFEMPLWQKNVPNFQKTDEKEIRTVTDIISYASVQDPNIAVYLPSKRNSIGKAVVIFPGGGYSRLAYDWEGSDVAKWLNSKGI